MAKTELRAKWNPKGFVPGKDISETYWNRAIDEFALMYNQFAQMSNQVLDKINDTWERYESIKRLDTITGSSMATYLTQQAMGIEEQATYGDWLAKWYTEICEAIDQIALISGFIMRSDIWRDEDGNPHFGVKFGQKPEWKIYMTVEQAEV